MTPLHFGSLYSMVDYKNETMNLYFNATFRPTEKLSLTGSVVYNTSKAEQDAVLMADVSEEVHTWLPHQDFTFEEMNSYSDLEYKLLQLGFGFEYLIQSGFSYTGQVDYADLSDEQGWVYGDESGSLLMVRTGVLFKF